MGARASRVVLVGVILALSAGLASEGNTVEGNPLQPLHMGVPVLLRAGGAAENPAERIRLTFEAVVEDSRCPRGARCVWEGNARAVFLFAAPEGKARVELNTSSRFDRQAACFGHTLRLEELAPYPVSGAEIAAGGYTATVRVTRP